MLYVENTPYPQVLMVPDNGLEPSGASEAVLVIRSTTEKAVRREITAVIAAGGGLYHPVAITLPQGEESGRSSLADGSYEYELTEGGKVLSSGCLQLGEYVPAARMATSGSGVSFRQAK